MKRIRLILVLAGLAVIGGCTPGPRPGSSIERDAIHDAQDRAFRGG